MFTNFMETLMIVGVILVGLLAIGLILARLYRRASKEVAFVRTGLGGQKVVMNGGALVFPVLHEVIRVNMNTMRLEVQRKDAQALITHDRMRVDVLAEFYTRVQPTSESIANAAQTLGQRTMMPDALRELVEGKLVDALRSVAAEMAMEDLHEQRVSFVQKVQVAVSEDLLKNGLELESVSLTGLDQTNREFFNPDNAFDAAGLTRLTSEIEEKRKRRNEIERDTQVSIDQKNLETERQTLEIARDAEYARLQQEREIEIRRASQVAEIKREQADRDRDAREAEIEANQKVELTQILTHRQVEEERIENERVVKQRDIERQRAIETTEVDRQKTVELANQDRDIAVSEKSKAQSEAETQANHARAEAAKSEEMVITAREIEVVEREKEVDLVNARRAAEREAIQVTIAAEAEKNAAVDEAEAIRTLANASSEKVRIEAQGAADAERMQVEVAERRYEVDAEGSRALNEAENLLSNEIVDMRVRLKIIEHMSDIVRESVKPVENIDGIKIIHFDGMKGFGGNPASGGTDSGGKSSLADQVVSSALQYRSQAPLVDALLKEIGLDADDLSGLTRAAIQPGNDGGEEDTEGDADAK